MRVGWGCPRTLPSPARLAEPRSRSGAWPEPHALHALPSHHWVPCPPDGAPPNPGRRLGLPSCSQPCGQPPPHRCVMDRELPAALGDFRFIFRHLSSTRASVPGLLQTTASLSQKQPPLGACCRQMPACRWTLGPLVSPTSRAPARRAPPPPQPQPREARRSIRVPRSRSGPGQDGAPTPQSARPHPLPRGSGALSPPWSHLRSLPYTFWLGGPGCCLQSAASPSSRSGPAETERTAALGGGLCGGRRAPSVTRPQEPFPEAGRPPPPSAGGAGTAAPHGAKAKSAASRGPGPFQVCGATARPASREGRPEAPQGGAALDPG